MLMPRILPHSTIGATLVEAGAVAYEAPWPLQHARWPAPSYVVELAVEGPAICAQEIRRTSVLRVQLTSTGRHLQHLAVILVVDHDATHSVQPAWHRRVNMREAPQQCLIVWDSRHARNDGDGTAP